MEQSVGLHRAADLAEGGVAASPACPLCATPDATLTFTKEYRERKWELRRCRKCTLSFTHPRPTQEFLNECYAGDYHADLREDGATERLFGSKFGRYTNWLQEFVPAGGRTLDIGCATGLLVRMLQDKGYRAEGLELNTLSADWGRQHYGVTIHGQVLEECNFAPGSFEAVTLTDVLEHTPHPQQYLAQVRQLLTPGGVALITFPDVESVESRYLYRLAQVTKRSWVWRNCNSPLHIWEFTPATATACFTGAGFQVRGFRRSHDVETGDMPVWFKVLSGPARLLKIPALAARWGTQMEFVIRT